MKLTYHDDSHRYYLDGKRCKSASAIAKRLEDGYRLDLWKQRQVAIGIATHPALIDRIAAHFDDRDALNTIVEEAHTHAKTQQAAERGTAMHRFTERADNNEAILATELATATIHAWRTALDEAGLDVVDGWTETIVAYPDSLVCGRMDRIVRRRADGRMFILDLKTGAKALSYPHAIAVQLALYANAPVAYIIDGQSGSSDKMLTLPAELDKDIALVFAMPTPEEWSIVPVRIDSAWRVAQDAILGPFGALAWEKADDLVLPAIVEHTPPTAPLDPADDPFAGITPDTDPPADEGALVEPATPEVAATTSGELDVPPAYTTREWILERVRQLAAIHPEALTALAGEWPTGVPGLASKAMLSPAEWKLVDAAVAKIETAVEAPFVPGPRNHEGDGWVSQMAAAITNIAPTPLDHLTPELPDASDAHVDAVCTMLNALGTGQPALWAQARLVEARDALVPIAIRRVRSMRLVHVGYALVEWAKTNDDRLTRLGFALLPDATFIDDRPLGVMFATLTLEQAITMRQIGEGVTTGEWQYRCDDQQGERFVKAGV